nr:outer dense fiber protein 2-like [Lytechinus pictus]
MTIDKVQSSLSSTSPPIHVHVDQETPVHVHVKKGAKKSASAIAVEEKMKASKNRFNVTLGSAGNMRPTSSARGPWVPAPGKSTRGQKFSWNGSGARLDIQPPTRDGSSSTMRMEDLGDGDNKMEEQYRDYEDRIDSLMTEVGSLKTQREVEKSKRAAERAKEELKLSRRVLEEQEEELLGFKEELHMTEKENRHLRKSMEQLKEEADTSKLGRSLASSERDQLLKKLVETEMDAKSAANQVEELRDVVQRLRETMLRDEHKRQSHQSQAAEQRDVLLKKLTEAEALNQSLRLEVLESSRVVDSVRANLELERTQAKSLADLHGTTETTRAHLQNQLRKREADCNRMAVQIRNLENQIEREKLEADHLRAQLLAAKEKACADKEALKRATRVQKDRASRSEDAVEKLQLHVMETEAKLAEMGSQLDEWKGLSNKVTREKTQLESDNSSMKRNLDDLELQVRELDMTSRVNLDRVKAELHHKSTEASNLKLENEKLQISVKDIQDKLTHAHSNIDQLKSSIQQYESLVADYKAQFTHTEQHVIHTMNQSRREALDVSLQLEQSQHEASRVKQETSREIDKVRGRLEQRLLELEPLPGMLRSTEQKLVDATERLLEREKKTMEQTKLITELSTKADQSSTQLENFRQKWMSSDEECHALKAKFDSVQRRLQDCEKQNEEFRLNLSKRDESVHQMQLNLEEQKRENSGLIRQLEQSIADSRRLEEESREKALARERNSQARVLDLEAQLSRVKSELIQNRRQKEDLNVEFNSQV